MGDCDGAAIDLRADSANLVVNGKITQVKPETLKVGDTIIVRIGEIIPADGEIIDGQGTLDMSSQSFRYESPFCSKKAFQP